jgi:hypothetical protein
MFSTAKPISSKPTAKAKQEKQEHTLAGISDIAKLDALIKAATAMKASIETGVKEAGFAIFVESAGGVRPTSFRGVDGDASASVEMRKRGTNSALNDDEANVLREAGYEPFKQIVTNGLFAINPKYAEDGKLLGRVEKALTKIVPDDFIVRQEEVSKLVVSDAILDEAFRKDADAAVLQIMTTMALKPKLNAEYDMASLIDDVSAIMKAKPLTVEVLDAPALPVAKAPTKKLFGKSAA